jgi:hypothetical protein
MLEFGASILEGEWPNRPWLRWAAGRMARNAAFTTPAAAGPASVPGHMGMCLERQFGNLASSLDHSG